MSSTTSTDLAKRYVLSVPVNPVPLGRARVVGRRSFTPPGSAQFVGDFRWALRALPHRPRRPLDGDLAVILRFYRQTKNGAHRGDLDNLVKAVYDAGNGELWHDDRQIVSSTESIEASGPKVEGHVFLIISPVRSRVDEAASIAEMMEIVEQLRQAKAWMLREYGDGMVAHLDQRDQEMRALLDMIDADLDDPVVKRTVYRVVAWLLRESIETQDTTLAGRLTLELAAALAPGAKP